MRFLKTEFYYSVNKTKDKGFYIHIYKYANKEKYHN